MPISLFELRHYLRQKTNVSLSELSAYFRKEPQFMRLMLRHWIRKGSVRCWRKQCQASCHGCSFAVTEWYEWLDQRSA